MSRTTQPPQTGEIPLKPLTIGVDQIRSMSTYHSDPIAALLEFVDNVKDLAKNGEAETIHIDKEDINPERGGKHLLYISNDGPGLSEEKIHHNLFGLGYSTKKHGDFLVGQFGQGINAAVSFFGGECTIFSQPLPGIFIVALFSEKLMRYVGKEQKMLFVRFDKTAEGSYNLFDPVTNAKAFETLCFFSPFKNGETIVRQFMDMERMRCNMRYALMVKDFSSLSVKWTNDDMLIDRLPKYDRMDQNQPLFETSLRDRLSINYIHPNSLEMDKGLKMFIRQKAVEHSAPFKTFLNDVEQDTYIPQIGTLNGKSFDKTHAKSHIMVGNCKKELPKTCVLGKDYRRKGRTFDFYGVLLYNRGRLVEWGKIGYQKQRGNKVADRVVLIANYDILQVDANKENFVQNDVHRRFFTKITTMVNKKSGYGTGKKSKAGRNPRVDKMLATAPKKKLQAKVVTKKKLQAKAVPQKNQKAASSKKRKAPPKKATTTKDALGALEMLAEYAADEKEVDEVILYDEEEEEDVAEVPPKKSKLVKLTQRGLERGDWEPVLMKELDRLTRDSKLTELKIIVRTEDHGEPKTIKIV